ncbi:hypothetical protein GCM10010182_06800 [Actinomadura cremea]|nr:hypothetical protein GCM10010182_06800 [Actinomadura cremea]
MEPLRREDPRRVGPYRLERRLGGGGMGQVFLGRSRGGRTVAVKVVRPEFAGDDGFRRRFALEIEAARRVGGFHTAQVVDADPDAEPPWLVTAYVPGPSLHEAVDLHGALPLPAIGVLGRGLAEGLTAIHACRLVHRDLKPSNVILAEDGPRVIDFGIARALDATSHTATHAVIGTPSFMSPEQAVGAPVGPASDVFSLGAVLAFAATGRTPFGTGPAQAVIYRVVHREPDLTGLSAPLAELVAACLAKDPGDRPPVGDVLERLGAFDQTPARWLPPEVTTMIDERTVPLGEPGTAEHRTSGGRDDRTTLTVGNLGRDELRLTVDGTDQGTIGAGGRNTLYLPAGTHSVQVRRGSSRSAPRSVELHPGAPARLAFDGGADTAPESAGEVSFAHTRLAQMLVVFRNLAGLTALFGVPGVGLGAPLSDDFDALEGAQLLLFVLGLAGVLSLSALVPSPDRLILRPDGLTFVFSGVSADRPAKTIAWADLDRIGVVGEGRKAKLVAWYREEHLPVPGVEVAGGTLVCRARDVVGPQDGPRLRAALDWFAGDVHVEQRT